MRPSYVWAVLAIFYLAFFSWYTSFGGPLTAAEIERYISVLAAGVGDPEPLATWRAFMESDTGDDFAMLNVMELRETPEQVEGVRPGDTTAEVLARYTGPFLGAAFRSAAHPVLMGQAAAGAMDLWGIEGAREWTAGALLRYRSRRDLMEQAVFASSLDIHRFKTAALTKTIAFPIDPWFQLGDPRLLLGLALGVLGLGSQLWLVSRRARGT